MKNDFFKDLDTFSKERWAKYYDMLKDHNMLNCMVSVELLIDIDKDFYEKYDLNKDIQCVLKNNSSGCKMTYYYTGIEIKPDCYYNRPEGYQEVSTLEMLQEAIKHDTHTPDIKHLELPENV